MQTFMRELGVHLVAIAQMNWRDGEYHEHWAPIIRGQRNHALGPSDLWSNISHNLARTRLAPAVGKGLSPDEFTKLRDASGDDERLASSISVSLRNLDSATRQIAQFYNEELTFGIAAGRTNGLRFATSRDQTLDALVHAFFLHMGSIRDYLATYIAVQLALDSAKIESMARLVDTLRGDDAGKGRSPLLALLIDSGHVAPIGAPSTKWKVSGWMEAMTDLRNEFVHRRTYGQHSAEGMGRLIAIDEPSGLFRYARPLIWQNSEHDAYDLIVSHYVEMNALLFAAAAASGRDTSLIHITDKDMLPGSFLVRR